MAIETRTPICDSCSVVIHYGDVSHLEGHEDLYDIEQRVQALGLVSMSDEPGGIGVDWSLYQCEICQENDATGCVVSAGDGERDVTVFSSWVEVEINDILDLGYCGWRRFSDTRAYSGLDNIAGITWNAAMRAVTPAPGEDEAEIDGLLPADSDARDRYREALRMQGMGSMEVARLSGAALEATLLQEICAALIHRHDHPNDEAVGGELDLALGTYSAIVV